MNRAIQDTGVVGSPQPDLGDDVSANEVWEANLHCRYKAYLRLSGQHGTKCDYESMCHQLRANVERVASEKLLAQNTMGEVLANVTLTRHSLCKPSRSSSMHICQRLWACFTSTVSRRLKELHALEASTTCHFSSTEAPKPARNRRLCSTCVACFSLTCRGECQAEGVSTVGENVGWQLCGSQQTSVRYVV